jgi:hypothetical protein
MAVALDHKSGPSVNGNLYHSAVSPMSVPAAMAVGGANSALGCLFLGDGAALPGLTVNWDFGGTPQAMTQAATAVSGSTGVAYAYALIAPHAGTLGLQVTWTGGTSREIVMFLISFTGVDQTGGATSFQGVTNNSGGSASNPATTGTITSGANDGMCGVFIDDNTASSGTVSDTAIDVFQARSNYDSNANYALALGNHALTCTWNASCNWAAAGINFASASAATTLIGSQQVVMMSRSRVGWRKIGPRPAIRRARGFALAA